MKAMTVCVEYDDLLAITLPQAQKHFDEIIVVTSPTDIRTIQYCKESGINIYATDAFYRNRTSFNKGLALEEGFDIIGREGWICIFDSDIVMPDILPLPALQVGKLYSPFRKIVTNIHTFNPHNKDWSEYYRFPDLELAGYFHLFHADDPAIFLKRPWYGTNWKHAGGCDSHFMSYWKEENKIRLQFDVLHLGETEVNWHGRTTAMRGGALPQDGEERKRTHSESMELRRRTNSNAHEKLR